MKKIVKRAGLISGIILSAFVIGGCGKTVDLNDCVEVKVSGIDGKGKAEVTVDYDKMETLLAKELNIEVKDKDIENIEDLGSAVDGLSKIDQAENCVNFQVQPADNLKNGDKITVKSIIDEEKAKELGIKLTNLLFGNSMYVGGIIFLFIPVVVVVFCYFMELFMKTYFPTVWKIISGRR